MTVTTMAEDLLSGVTVRSGFALSLIDPNRTEPDSPVSRLDLRDSVRACFQMRDFLIDAWRLSLGDAIDNRIDDYNAVGKICLVGFDIALKTFRAVQRALDAASEEGRLADLGTRSGTQATG